MSLAALQPGDRIGRFSVVRHLGRGGMGTVFEAHDQELSRALAIKLVNDRAADPVRLLREAQALAQISHPNVVAIYELGTHRDDVFVAMELVDGVTIDRYLADTRATAAQVIALYLQAGRGLCAVHEQGLIHRDVKPSNLLVDRTGRVRVSDFGLARRDGGDVEGGGTDGAPPTQARADAVTVDGPTGTSIDSRPEPPSSASDALAAPITAHGAVVGTPRYMAPEQRAGRATRATDQYAFAVSLWEALDGDVPGGAAASTKVPAWAVPILRRALEVDPAKRWPTLAALLDELERAPRRRRRIAIGVAAGGVVLAGAAATYALGVFDRATVDCARAADPVAAAWPGEARARVEAAFGALGPAWTSTLPPVLDGLDRWSGRARDVRIDACRATHEHKTQSEPLLDKRAVCLDGQQAVFGAFVAALGAADRAVARSALAAIDRLPAPETCTAARLVEATVAPAGPVEATLAEATVAVELQRADAGALTARLVEATQHGSSAQRARARVLRGRALAATDPKAARAELDAALADAAASRDPVLEADIALATLMTAARTESADRIDTLLPAARAAVARAESPRALALGLAIAEMAVHQRLGRADQAKEACARATGLSDPARAELTGADCACRNALLARAPDEATLCARSVELTSKALGDGHPRTADVRHNWITGLVRRRQLAEADKEVRANLVTMTQLYGRDSTDVISELQLQSLVQDRQEKIAESRVTLEEALAISDRVNGMNSPARAGLLIELADRCLQLKDRAAIQYAESGLATIERLLGPDHRDLGAILITHAKALALDPTQMARSRESWRRAITHAEKHGGPASYVLGATLENHAMFLATHDALLESLDPAKRAVEVFDAAGERYTAGNNEILVAEIYIDLARMPEARTWLAKARTRFAQLGDDRSKKKLVEIDELLAKAK